MRSLINLFIIKPQDFVNLIKEASNTSISRERYIDLVKVISIFAVIYSTIVFLSLESSGHEVLIYNSSSRSLYSPSMLASSKSGFIFDLYLTNTSILERRGVNVKDYFGDYITNDD